MTGASRRRKPAASKSIVSARSGCQLIASLTPSPAQPGMVTLHPSGEIRHDPRRVPWPVTSGSVLALWVTRVAEYVPPASFYAWVEELDRVTLPGAKLYLAGAYGMEPAWLLDPAHQSVIVEQTFWAFDPRSPQWARFKPKTNLVTLAATRTPGPDGPWYNIILEKQAHG